MRSGPYTWWVRRPGPRAYAAALAALLLAGCAGGGAAGEEVVARVVDGDTIVLEGGQEVRLVQIDAPEGREGECYADEAREALRRLLPAGARVRLEADPRLDDVDVHGRLLRYVVLGEANANLALVAQGAATVWFFRGERGRYADELLREARRARDAGLGLWGACPGTPFDPGRPADTGAGGDRAG
jgi:micrococcal nuclease